MFADVIGVGQPDEPTQAPNGNDGSGGLSAALYGDSADTDVERLTARDLMDETMDRVLAEMFRRIDLRKQFDPFYMNDDDSPEAAFGLPPVDYMQGAVDDPQVEAAFQRYMPVDGPEASTYQPGTPIPISPDSFGPIQKAIEPPFSSMARGGYREAITDPSGELMRGALRRLVRSV